MGPGGVMFKALVRSVSLEVKPFVRSLASSSVLARQTTKTKASNQTSVLATLSRTQDLFKTYKPVTPGLRHLRRPISPHLYDGRPIRALTIAKRKKGGRNNHGRITVRHRGGGHRRRIRIVDFKRMESGEQDVVRIEFDPGRSAHIALLKHRNPDAKMLLSYILAPEDLRAGHVVESFREGIPDGLVAGFIDKHWKGRRTRGGADATTTVTTPVAPPSPSLPPSLNSATTSSSPITAGAPVKPTTAQDATSFADDGSRQLSIGILRALVIRPGNVLPLRIIPPGTVIHAIALDPNGPAILVRSAGSFATVISQDGDTEKGGKYTQVKLQSGEIRHILSSCCATIGRVSNPNWKDRSLGKAGRSRNLGWRPSVRGVAMNAYVLLDITLTHLFADDELIVGFCLAEWITRMGVVEVNRKAISILGQSGAGRRKGEGQGGRGPKETEWWSSSGLEEKRSEPVNSRCGSRPCHRRMVPITM